jgi:hypothetical protein
MMNLILLDTVEHRFEVTDDVAEQFFKDKKNSRGKIDSTLVEFLSENNRLSEETIEHNDYVLNTFEDISE